MNKIVEIKFGSHLYGTDTPSSDLDIKSVYIPEARDILLGRIKKTIQTGKKKAEKERNTKDDVDVESFSLCRFVELLIAGQTVAIDAIFAPDWSFMREPSKEWRILQENVHRFLTNNVGSFIGYTKQQAAKYGIKGSRMDALKRTQQMLDPLYRLGPYHKLGSYLTAITDLIKDTNSLISLEKTPLISVEMCKGPTGEYDQPHLQINGRKIPFHATVTYARQVVDAMYNSYGARAHKAHLASGVDWKALSHAVRVASEAIELLQTGKVTFPRPDRELLLQIKTGMLPYERVADIIEQGLASLYEVQKTSVLQEKPDRDWADNFIYDIYKNMMVYS